MSLKVTTENRDVIGLLAEQAGISYEAYVNNTAQLGVGLGQTVLQFSPEPLRICFWVDPPCYSSLPLEFDAEPAPVIDPLFNDFERDLQPDRTLHPLPIEPGLLPIVDSVTSRLLVSRRDFLAASFMFMQHAVVTLQAEMPVVIVDSSNERYLIDFELTG